MMFMRKKKHVGNRGKKKDIARVLGYERVPSIVNEKDNFESRFYHHVPLLMECDLQISYCLQDRKPSISTGLKRITRTGRVCALPGK